MWKWRRVVFQQGSQQMTFQMMHCDGRDVPGVGKTARQRRARLLQARNERHDPLAHVAKEPIFEFAVEGGLSFFTVTVIGTGVTSTSGEPE